MRMYPGVEPLLDALEAKADVVLGLLTGNLEGGAELKLRVAGVDFDRFRVGAYGSDAADRAELPSIAARRAEPIMGHRPHGEEIVIIGDTPADVTCGRRVGARAIGVATGRHPVEELDAAGAYRSFETLADTDGVLDAILA
jgi:phosphoglycolate phosphatase-like HAD superfamily hydrolase